ncbi:ATP-binding protein [Streptomyces sp. NRRL F-5630]|uniref:ATP-binding protein n=1 Tax=Streptomyces sp. NRRL F-5630 TaxID=1463864 RepID=UPI003EBC4635
MGDRRIQPPTRPPAPRGPGLHAAPTGRPSYGACLPRVEASARPARRLIQHALTAWGLDALAPDAQLLVTEMAANAVQHGHGTALSLTVARLDDGVRVTVADASRALPVLRHPADDAEHGRGLLLVAATATRWGTDPHTWGKEVWAEVCR